MFWRDTLFILLRFRQEMQLICLLFSIMMNVDNVACVIFLSALIVFSKRNFRRV